MVPEINQLSPKFHGPHTAPLLSPGFPLLLAPTDHVNDTAAVASCDRSRLLSLNLPALGSCPSLSVVCNYIQAIFDRLAVVVAALAVASLVALFFESGIPRDDQIAMLEQEIRCMKCALSR